jgi:LAS superfamily LD-carboxypeptidase LdcB
MLRKRYDPRAMLALRRRVHPSVLTLLAAALTTVLVAATSLPATAASTSSIEQLRQQRRELQRRRAAEASQINVLQASTAQLDRALDALTANRRSQQAAVERARQRSATLRAKVEQTKAAQARTRGERDRLQAALRSVAVNEFMRGLGGELPVTPGLRAPEVAARRAALLSVAAETSEDLADQLRAVQDDLRVQRQATEAAAAAALVEQHQVEQRLSELVVATRQQQAVADKIEARLEAKLSEAAALAAIDAGLARQIAAQQASLARRLRGTTSRASVGRAIRVGNISLSTVRGITVASSVASRLARLLDAASAAGIRLGGGGYRNPNDQAALRRAHCGGDVYRKPASRCRPPTARPGHSMHERGLAVDFTSNGRLITSRGSTGFRWLKANASRYGFYNLPSEPWHWSVNGN